MQIHQNGPIIAALLVLLGGCQSANQYQLEKPIELPDDWQIHYQNVQNDYQQSKDALGIEWPTALSKMIQDADKTNQQIVQARLELDKSNAELMRAGAALWPSLDFEAGASRGGRSQSQNADEDSNNGAASSDFSLGVTARYEIDLWGRLSDAKKLAQIALKQDQLSLKSLQLDLTSNLADNWYQKAAAESLVELYQKRLANVRHNLDTIENGYRTGVTQAVDVYLTRNTLASEQSTLLEQQNQLADLHRQLNLLVGGYPSEQLDISAKLSLPSIKIPEQLPVEWVKQRPDVQSAWLNILSQNASLAIAHKNRFPQFSLTARLSDNQNSVSDLLSNGFAWSLGANLLQPIFDAGNLKAAESIAKTSLQQAEFAYIRTLYEACLEVESLLADIATLKQRLGFAQTSLENALSAEKLSYNQYLSGISGYTTYLEAQRRLYSAQAAHINLTQQYISAYIQLIRSLGGQKINPNRQSRSTS